MQLEHISDSTLPGHSIIWYLIFKQRDRKKKKKSPTYQEYVHSQYKELVNAPLFYFLQLQIHQGKIGDTCKITVASYY